MGLQFSEVVNDCHRSRLDLSPHIPTTEAETRAIAIAVQQNTNRYTQDLWDKILHVSEHYPGFWQMVLARTWDGMSGNNDGAEPSKEDLVMQAIDMFVRYSGLQEANFPFNVEEKKEINDAIQTLATGVYHAIHN